MNSNVVDTSDFKPIDLIDGVDLSHYKINSQGTVINTKKKNKIIKTYKHKVTGYIYLSRFNQKHTFIHRLVGKVYLKNGEEYFKECLENGNKKYQINHRDKNRSNNCVENLEWTTPSENMAHGCGVKVVRIDLETGDDLQTYNTITEAREHLKKLSNSDKIAISGISAVCRGKTRKSAYGYGWRYA